MSNKIYDIIGPPPERPPSLGGTGSPKAWKKWIQAKERLLTKFAQSGEASSLEDLGFNPVPEQGAAKFGTEWGDPEYWKALRQQGISGLYSEARPGMGSYWGKGGRAHFYKLPGLDIAMGFSMGAQAARPDTWQYINTKTGKPVSFNPSWQDKALQAAEYVKQAGDQQFLYGDDWKNELAIGGKSDLISTYDSLGMRPGDLATLGELFGNSMVEEPKESGYVAAQPKSWAEAFSSQTVGSGGMGGSSMSQSPVQSEGSYKYPSMPSKATVGSLNKSNQQEGPQNQKDATSWGITSPFSSINTGNRPSSGQQRNQEIPGLTYRGMM